MEIIELGVLPEANLGGRPKKKRMFRFSKLHNTHHEDRCGLVKWAQWFESQGIDNEIRSVGGFLHALFRSGVDAFPAGQEYHDE